MNYENREYKSDNNYSNSIGDSHIATWDFENQVCKLTVDGEVLFGGTECLYEVEDGKVTDFQIIGIGLSK